MTSLLTGLENWSVQVSLLYLISLAYLTLLLIMLVIERALPHARPSCAESMKFNLTYTVVMLALVAVLKPLAMAIAFAIPADLGLGWLRFPSTALGWLGALVSLALVTDFLEYWFHRAQHTFTLLWKMHKLHHSAEHFDVTLSYRHFWVEPLLKTALVYPLPAVLLKCPQSATLVVAAIWQLFQYVAHMNVRFSPKALGLVFTHPQYHRIHHSRAALHYNKNLCALLPLWDILFGTLHRPAQNEFVDVGLEGVSPPQTMWEAIAGPFQPSRAARLHATEA